jgi:WD40 repeat protein
VLPVDQKTNQDKNKTPDNYSRFDRIRAFFKLVNSECHALIRFGALSGFCVQQAYNSANSGPVANAAEQVAKNIVSDTILLIHPSQRANLDTHSTFIRALEGHSEDVTCVSMTHDGKLCVSGSKDKSLRVWNLENGKCIKVLRGHKGEISSLSITPDGKRAVSGSLDRTLRVWDLESGACVRELKNRRMCIGWQSPVLTVSITPDGARAVSGSSNRAIRIWDLERGKCLKTLRGHKGSVNSICITPDGKRAVTGSKDRSLRVWDLENERCLSVLEKHGRGISGVCVTLDCKAAVSAEIWQDNKRMDSNLWFWALESGECLKRLAGHRSSINCVSITPDGTIAVSGSGSDLLFILFGKPDNTVRIWDIERGVCLKTLNKHRRKVNAVSITPDGRRAISGSSDKSLVLWDLTGRECQGKVEEYKEKVHCVALTPDSRKILSGSGRYITSKDCKLRLWDLERAKCIATIEAPYQQEYLPFNCAIVTPDEKRIISGSGGRLMKNVPIRIWDMQTGRCIGNIHGHTKEIYGINITPDGKWAVSGGLDKVLRVWDLDRGACLRYLKGHRAPVSDVVITSDGKIVLSGSWDSTIRVWDINTGECIRILKGHLDRVTSVSIKPDGKLAVSGRSDHTVKVWNLETGQCLRSLDGHVDWVSGVSLTLSGKNVISGSRDATIRVWDIDLGKQIAVYPTKDIVTSISQMNGYGRFACGTELGKLVFLTAHNLTLSPSIITPVRIWLYEKNEEYSGWDDVIRTRCSWCGRLFPVEEKILDEIKSIMHSFALSTDQSPCLELPSAAWDEPQLLSECPHCQRTLRFNPFIVDNSGRF